MNTLCFRAVLCVFVCSLWTVSAQAQVVLQSLGDSTTFDFSTFGGAGFTPTPAVDQLDSDTWSVLGLSDGDLLFGGTGTTGDYARGIDTGGVSAGGIYAFEVAPANRTLGFQPTRSDMVPGIVRIAVLNDTGGTITALDIDFTVWDYNDGHYRSYLALDFAPDSSSAPQTTNTVHYTRERAASNPVWKDRQYKTSLTGLDIGDGVIAIVSFRSADISYWSSNGQSVTCDNVCIGEDPPSRLYRDEIALDDITIEVKGFVAASCSVDADCDDGQPCNGTETCVAGACQTGTPASAGAPCGDSTDTTCNPADVCDGANACVTNIAAAGVPCGPLIDTTCDPVDLCDGAGLCDVRVAAAGVACGDPSVSVCDGADGCDGVGTCDPNHVAFGSSCSDGFFCNGDESCDGAGTCDAGTPPVIDDGVGCTSDRCDEVNDVVANTPDDTACDDGDPCTQNTCDALNDCQDTSVACSCVQDADCDDGNVCNGAETCSGALCIAGTDAGSGTSCGDPSSSACDGSDSCDGSGRCVENLAPSGTACGDASGSVCDAADACDGIGNCDPVYAASGTSCSDLAFCNGEETCDGSGACTPGAPPVDDDGISCTLEVCDESTDTIVHDPDDDFCGDGDLCTADFCDPALGCQSTTIACDCQQDGDINPLNRCEICEGQAWSSQTQGTPCEVQHCDSAGALVGAATCDNTGVCLAPAPTQCANGCADAACVDPCSSDTDCASGWVCDNGVCHEDLAVDNGSDTAPPEEDANPPGEDTGTSAGLDTGSTTAEGEDTASNNGNGASDCACRLRASSSSSRGMGAGLLAMLVPMMLILRRRRRRRHKSPCRRTRP